MGERMSARFIGDKLGKDADWVYGIWKEMGLINEQQQLTEKGREIGGRMSKSNYPVPTFDFDDIERRMYQYVKHGRK